ncbi:MAG: hypothetical protein PVH84_18065 [Candidatus Aminicenantes bacterium]
MIRGLPAILRNPLDIERAKNILERRLLNKESNFLELIQRAVYENPKSPYLKMFELAGCEYGDLERLLDDEGLEGALQVLFRQGVYLTIDEFKGRKPVVRNGHIIEVDPGLLRNPLCTPYLQAQTSGSGGESTPVPIDMDFVRERNVNHFLALWHRGGSGWDHAVWGVPGHTDIVRILDQCRFGEPPVRWFSQVDPTTAGLHPRYRWSARILRWVGILCGVSIPSPEYVPPNRPLPIVRWLRETLDRGKTPHLVTFVGPAVRVCQAALEEGLDISGSEFSIGGEPLTEKRMALIERCGIAPVTRYGAIETGNFGYGCLNPDAPDDQHLYHDLHGVIQPKEEDKGEGLPPNALLISSLLLSAPFVLINVSLGDQAVIEKRSCGCPLGSFGWTTHIKKIRSFERLTCGGMTFFDSEIIPVLEEVLPAHFGGTAIDYQIVERESDKGSPQLLLIVNPNIGPIDENRVKEVFLDAIGSGSGAKRIMSLQWRSAGFLTVERRVPQTTMTGKIWHVLQSNSS